MSYRTSTYKCSICLNDFQAERRASYCSANCRKKASRRREQLEKTYERAFEAVRSLAENLQPDSVFGDNAMKQDAIKLLQKLDLNIAENLQPHIHQRHIYGSLNRDRENVTSK